RAARIGPGVGTRIDTAAVGHVGSGCASHSASGRCATINVLAVAQFMIVPGGVVTLGSEEHLQSVLTVNVHRQKLLAILPFIVRFQLDLSGKRSARRYQRPRNPVKG